MTAQLLASELANLIQESKRKHNDLRQVRGVLRTVLWLVALLRPLHLAHSNTAHYTLHVQTG